MAKEEPAPTTPHLQVLQIVRCLECNAVYTKPSGGGTATANPGCPECGYVGWASTSAPLTEPSLLHRFAGDPRRRHSA